KVLLLGAGESGKSTFGKQLKMLSRGSMSSKETDTYRRAIRQNLAECMQTLLDAGKEMGIPLVDMGLELAAKRIQEMEYLSGSLTPDQALDIANLWADAGIQQVWAHKDKFWILDSTPYYMQEAMRLAEPDYTPTEEDVVMSRVITSGVGTVDINEPPHRFTVVDVGGQRNERKKWLHCFDDVKAIVFLVSLAGYNQV
ncbi:unnamed protein product, partial [Discosporangium mesarthrocarpum]